MVAVTIIAFPNFCEQIYPVIIQHGYRHIIHDKYLAIIFISILISGMDDFCHAVCFRMVCCVNNRKRKTSAFRRFLFARLYFWHNGASMAGFYCFIELLGLSRIRTTLLYLVLIGIWCAFLIILNLKVPDHDEGKGILLYIAFASGIIGIAAWPLCIVKISRIYAIVISVLSVLVSLLYLIVAFRMHNF